MPLNDNSENEKKPGIQEAQTASRQIALAMELPFVFVATVVVGGGIGYLVDRWLHTSPVFLLILGGLGFVAGVREILRRLATK